MSFAIPVWTTPSVPVKGLNDPFPVRRIYCVGRNYAAHAREMGADPDREPPFFFMKPADTIVLDGGTVPYPPATSDLHHEIELVVAIGRGGRSLAAGDALDHVYGYAVGLDMTRRDIQAEAKKHGRPWDMGKGFDHSAPCSLIRRVSEIGHPSLGAIRLDVNGSTRQTGDLADMTWPVPDILASLSALVRLMPGDLIYTGTPEGVGPVGPGDSLYGHIDGVGDLAVTIG